MRISALAAFEDRPVSYDPAEIARAGVVISIDSDGSLSVDRGYVRPEDDAPASTNTDGETGGDGDASEGGDPVRAALRRGLQPHRPLGIPVGEHLLAAARQRFRQRCACTRSRDPRDDCLDRHQWVAGADTRVGAQTARCAMSIPDHARANFQTLLRAAADGNLALI
jgi:hypothetical protein